MNKSLEHYILLADIFEYPDKDYTEKTAKVQQFLEGHYPTAAKMLKPFTEYMSKAPLHNQEELFIRSFDVQAVTTLDLGYVLFGDDYKRGELLVNLNREHREVQNDCGLELADYLANVLRLLPKMKDTFIVEELVKKIITPALKRMIRGFEPEQIKLKDKFYKKKHKTIIDRPDEHYTIFKLALEVLYFIFQQNFDFEEKELEENTSDFLKNITTEIKLEGT
ncbi:MAG: hypothetical protein GY705_01360 [Bacteroidetes bacterium]|nr:hypothetical protein [Bacteroidota bacterium]